eukprot:CAMPEP_0185762572 /NCGR_PEP_ID=MMETSP1174-20130828/21538_1 /TAXON_ID=35687 /ORGANISM="Dictyocha speculum, Strain CCMP1381" /LENGTH=153 /DNA_ID=CAMNT_0028444295 /DNA_START=54 /DNA_END=511 /DNA_ORIENTATION=+
METAIADREAAQRLVKAELEKLRLEKDEVDKMKKQLEDDLLACENKHAEEKSNLNDELEAMRAVKEQLDKGGGSHNETHDTIEKLKELHEKEKREVADGHMQNMDVMRKEHMEAQKELEDMVARMAGERDAMNSLQEKLEKEKLILLSEHNET